MTGRRHLKRTDLFLIRMWTEEVTETREGKDEGGVAWRGKVQRVVDGETYQFDSWPALVDLLQVLVSASQVVQDGSVYARQVDQGASDRQG
jgi:hypothetical protein